MNCQEEYDSERNNLMCISYEWRFMHNPNRMLRSHVYEEESLCA